MGKNNRQTVQDCKEALRALVLGWTKNGVNGRALDTIAVAAALTETAGEFAMMSFGPRVAADMMRDVAKTLDKQPLT